MQRLILTGDSSSAGSLKACGRADLVIPIERRLVWGPLPSDAQLEAFFAARSDQAQGLHWQDYSQAGLIEKSDVGGLGLIEAVARFETVELWMETDPNSQLTLIWLLDHVRSHRADVTNLTLCHVDAGLADAKPEQIARWTFPMTAVTKEHMEAAHLAWEAYRAPTPEVCFALLNQNLSVLPQLRRSIVNLLEELPWRTSGLGGSEMRILELISAGFRHPFDVFPHFRQRFQRRVFGYFEVGTLLEGLALAPTPVVAGLAEWPFTLELHEMRDRFERYKQSRLSLTAFGSAILAGTEDFSRRNPIDRWWGGTHLTNDNLWRWNLALMKP